MKKTDSSNSEKGLEKELKKLLRENAKLKAEKESDKAELKRLKKELKKRRSEAGIDRRTTTATFEPVPGHRFSIQLITLCVLIYVQTNCGLRTVVSILGIFGKVLGSAYGNIPAYTTVRNWILKLGLSVYEDDTPRTKKEFAVIMDESIMINKEKLLLTLGFNPEQTEPLCFNRLCTYSARIPCSALSYNIAF